MAVITISRQFGAGGWTLGEGLSKRLGYRYVDEDMVKQVAAKAKVSSGQIRAFEKEGGSKLMKFLNRVVSPDYIDRHITDKYGYVNESKYLDVITAIIQELYEEGNVVIIGRGGQYILKDKENAWHILLVDELSHRIRFVMDRYGIGENEAEKAIRQRDHIRTRFLKFFSDKGSHDDPLSYDLALNMRRVSMEKAEDLVVKLIS